MLVLFETPAGYALFQVLDEGKLSKPENIYKAFSTPENANQIVSLKAFSKFENTTEALSAATALVESKMDKGLKAFLKKNVIKKKLEDQLAVSDSKLGGVIKDKLGLPCIHDNAVNELMRGIRQQVDSLITGLGSSELHTMVLGLSHSLSRYKLKFSPDKVDVMIVQAISLLDDLDKELNTYAMRVKEWYGWHFPEMAKVITDNILYAKIIRAMGLRPKAADTDFSTLLTDDVEEELKEAAKLSMGTEISAEDLLNITDLANQVIEIHEYREQLYEYLKNRMQAIAPNLSVMVGELVGARLIAHAGSLINLAKYPASTVQILGAEKALFRALKTKHQTPKYGLIYHASLVGQAAPKNKGKISRVVASRSALAIRVDALGENVTSQVGLEGKSIVESRIRALEQGRMHSVSSGSAGRPGVESYRTPRKSGGYNPVADSTVTKMEVETPTTETPTKKQKKEKKEKKDKKDKKEKKEKKDKKDKKEKKKEKKGKKDKKRKRDSTNGDAAPKDDGGKKKKQKKKSK